MKRGETGEKFAQGGIDCNLGNSNRHSADNRPANSRIFLYVSFPSVVGAY